MLAALAKPHRIKAAHRRRRRIVSGTLDYNYFRDYEPGTGRYVESDPVGLAGGLNNYAYVDGNPFGFFDSLGLKTICVPVTKTFTEWFPGKGDVAFSYTGRDCHHEPDPPAPHPMWPSCKQCQQTNKDCHDDANTTFLKNFDECKGQFEEKTGFTYSACATNVLLTCKTTEYLCDKHFGGCMKECNP